jgi:hypothetical protein
MHQDGLGFSSAKGVVSRAGSRIRYAKSCVRQTLHQTSCHTPLNTSIAYLPSAYHGFSLSQTYNQLPAPTKLSAEQLN